MIKDVVSNDFVQRECDNVNANQFFSRLSNSVNCTVQNVRDCVWCVCVCVCIWFIEFLIVKKALDLVD